MTRQAATAIQWEPTGAGGRTAKAGHDRHQRQADGRHDGRHEGERHGMAANGKATGITASQATREGATQLSDTRPGTREAAAA